VEDGHKRLSLAIADGRTEVDADVDRYQTEFHVAPGTTIEAIRVTARERRFRELTGLARAVPRERFPLSDPDGYLELEESVKAHTLDLSYSAGRLIPADDGARHWFEAVYLQVLAVADASSARAGSRSRTPRSSSATRTGRPTSATRSAARPRPRPSSVPRSAASSCSCSRSSAWRWVQPPAPRSGPRSTAASARASSTR
jgi:hypothetical protein